MCFDPLDGSSNIDCLAPIGTIFAIYKKVRQQSTHGVIYLVKAKFVGYVNLLSFFPRFCKWSTEPEKVKEMTTWDSHVLKCCLNSQEGDIQPHEIAVWRHFPPSDTQTLKQNPFTIRQLGSSSVILYLLQVSCRVLQFLWITVFVLVDTD